MNQAGGPSPDLAASAGQDQDQQQGTATVEMVVECSVMSDGTFKLERETGDQEQAEQNGGGEQAGDSKPVVVTSVEDAVDVFKQYLNAAQSPQDRMQQNKSEQSQGYSGAGM